MPFRYLKDPVFLICLAAYFLNWGLEEFSLSPVLAQCYLNDVICIPFWVPIMVWVAKKLCWRGHDRRPDVIEIGIPVIMFSAVFEVVLPFTATFRNKTIADPYDVQSVLRPWRGCRELSVAANVQHRHRFAEGIDLPGRRSAWSVLPKNQGLTTH